MERLTKWSGSSNQHAYYPRCFEEPCNGGGCKIKDCPFETAVCERLAAYEDTGREPEEVAALEKLFDYALKETKTLKEQLALLNHIRELAEVDKDGRLVVLPFKVYETDGVRVYEHAVRGIIYRTAGGPDFDESTIGKSIFLTREEAERAMEEMEGRKDD